MRYPGICGLLLSSLLPTVLANTEKTIFIAPPAVPLSSDVLSGLAESNLDLLSPATASALRTSLEVLFPSEQHPHGRDSWYILHGLNEGQRYEVRICWAATQPTEFWIDTFEVAHVFDTPNLIQSLAESAPRSSAATPESIRQTVDLLADQSFTETILLLRVRAAADFYTAHKELMAEPPTVHVDIILDPYLGNIFPTSLVPTAGYILSLFVVGWILSRFVWSFVKSQSLEKQHIE